MELKHFELFLNGQKLDSIWYEGEKLWPATDKAVPETSQARPVLIEDVMHFYNLITWEYMREQGMVDGEYEATDHEAWDQENLLSRPELFDEVMEWQAGLTELPVIPDTSQATDLSALFFGFASLTSVPDLDARRAERFSNMFQECHALTDGSVRVIVDTRPSGRGSTSGMILDSGLTREPFYLPDGTPI